MSALKVGEETGILYRWFRDCCFLIFKVVVIQFDSYSYITRSFLITIEATTLGLTIVVFGGFLVLAIFVLAVERSSR